MKKKLTVLSLAAVVALGACGAQHTTATQSEAHAANKSLFEFIRNQPVPIFDWSQLRQNLIELETAQAHTTATYSFMFARGATGKGDPVAQCPSVGFPIPSTFQLTNPLKNTDGVALGQLEANGVYTGDTSGTYVMCLLPSGKAYASYWEGDVLTMTGTAKWNYDKHEAELVGVPSFNFSSGRK